MQVIFESRDTHGAQLRSLAVERVHFVLRRLSNVVPRAKVQFSDVNGPRGGTDKLCQVELTTDITGSLVISTLANDWRTALDRSLHRAARVLRKNLQRNNKPMRNRPGKWALSSE